MALSSPVSCASSSSVQGKSVRKVAPLREREREGNRKRETERRAEKRETERGTGRGAEKRETEREVEKRETERGAEKREREGR